MGMCVCTVLYVYDCLREAKRASVYGLPKIVCSKAKFSSGGEVFNMTPFGLRWAVIICLNTHRADGRILSPNYCYSWHNSDQFLF
jgi:hypothetical protein